MHHHDLKSPPEYFDPVPFILDGPWRDLDPNPQLFLCNVGGHGVQSLEPIGKPIDMEPLDPTLLRGTRYEKITAEQKTIQPESGDPYQIVEFGFGAKEVHYAALPATRENARAFGMTLMESGECVRFPYKDLIMAEYNYGKWAAYQSPYLGKGHGGELLTINPTDLEFHAFPHVFFSQDDLPLVITVARWRVYMKEIYLADLWLPRGSALVLPPQFPPDPQPLDPSPEVKRNTVVNLHGNRNSALACRFVDNKPMLRTTTILANGKAFADAKMKPNYYEEKTATYHPSGL